MLSCVIVWFFMLAYLMLFCAISSYVLVFYIITSFLHLLQVTSSYHVLYHTRGHTEPYRTIQDHMGLYWTIRDHTGPYGTDWLTCAISRGACASKNNVRALMKYYFIVNILINSQNLTPASGVWTLCFQYYVYQPWPVYSSSASEVVLLKMF